MRKLLRAVPALLALGLSATFVMCTADSPTNPFVPGPGGNGTGGGSGTNLPSLVVTASKFDINADGSDSATIIGTASNPDGSPLGGSRILWSVSTRNFSGGSGTLSSSLTLTDGNGQATVQYKAPKADFVPVGALVVVTGTLTVPNNPQGSPRSSVTLLLRPKGAAPSGGTGPAGQPVAPSVASVTPSTIKVDADPAVTVIVQGLNFTDTSQVLIVTSQGLTTISPQFFGSTQLRFTVPSSTIPGEGTLFVSGPGNQLSEGVSVTLTSGVVTTPDKILPQINAILPASGPITQTTRVVLLGQGFNVLTCPGQGNITAINEFLGLRKLCPVNSEPATAQRLVIDIPSVNSNQSGPVSIFVTNDDGSISNSVTFTYTTTIANAPQIAALSPNSGPTTGETRVILTGANYSAGDAVVIAGPNVFSPPTDTCSDGQPLCSNNQCVLSQARGICTINGNPNIDPFIFRGSGQIEIVTPNVGTNAAGPADVLVRTAGAATSNISTFNFQSPSNLLPPSISSLSFSNLAGFGCCPQGSYQFIIVGNNFRKCFSVVLSANSGIFEILPTPDVSDCAVRRGSNALESPRERLIRILPPDGETPSCGAQQDLVALRQVGPTSYRHDTICYGAAGSVFAQNNAEMIPSASDPNDVTRGGAVSWINESEIRLFFGPDSIAPCDGSTNMSVYVSNDPGRGLSGDFLSNSVIFTSTNKTTCAPAPTPTPLPAPPTITSLQPSSGTCNGGTNVIISGTNLNQGGAPSVQVGLNDATVLSSSATRVTIQVPAANPGGGQATCNSTPPFTCSTPPCGGLAGTPFGCSTVVTLTTIAGEASSTYNYTSNSPTSCCSLAASGAACAVGTDCCSSVCLGTNLCQ